MPYRISYYQYKTGVSCRRCAPREFPGARAKYRKAGGFERIGCVPKTRVSAPGCLFRRGNRRKPVGLFEVESLAWHGLVHVRSLPRRQEPALQTPRPRLTDGIPAVAAMTRNSKGIAMQLRPLPPLGRTCAGLAIFNVMCGWPKKNATKIDEQSPNVIENTRMASE